MGNKSSCPKLLPAKFKKKSYNCYPVQNFCSVYLEKQHLLIKGEFEKPPGQERNALITLIDCKSGLILGNFYL